MAVADHASRASLLCVHPHPDDESIACGGTLARYACEGLRVMVVTCTGGEEGDNLSGIDLGGKPMAQVRQRELARALEALGVANHQFLGYRDSGMAGTAANHHPASFHRAELDEAAGRLAAIIRAFRPVVVVSDDERGLYGHPDHVKAYRVTTRAIELAASSRGLSGGGPHWQVAKRYVHAMPRGRLRSFHRRMLAQGLPSPFGELSLDSIDELPYGVADETITTAVDVRPWLDRKREALRAHASQIGPDSFFFNLPADLAEELYGTEYYVLEGPPVDGLEDDLFAGLRV